MLSLKSLSENALAQREWRGLLHQSRDWRLWVGLRVPKDARGWGLPAVAWCCILPYALALMLRWVQGWLPRQYGYLPPAAMPDVLALSFGLVGLYLCLISAALMAPAITREREKETWETLRAAVGSPHEILVGLAAGRLGPVLAGYAAVAAFWWLTRPHYTPLFAHIAPFRLGPGELALLLVQMGALAAAAGAAALAASACLRTTGRAVLASTMVSLLLFGAGALIWFGIPRLPGALLILVVAAAIGAASYRVALRALHP